MIRKKKKTNKIVLDLTGPDGNAFVLLELARKLGRDLGKNVESIQEEMESDDYENLIQVFDREFGDFVILER